MASRVLTLVIFLTSLHEASGYAVDRSNATTRRTLNLVEFPPKSPVTIEAQILYTIGQPTELRIPVTIGNDEFRLQFDTGALVTWVMSDNAKDDKYASKRKFPSSQITGCEPDTLIYGAGELEIKGEFSAQDVEIMGVEKKGIQVLLVNEILYDQDDAFMTVEIDGIFGAQVPPQNHEEVSEAWLAGTKFAIDMNVAGSSTITFGEIDVSRGILVDVVPSEENSLDIKVPGLEKVPVDSGNAIMWLPPDYVQKLMSNSKIKGYPPWSESNDNDSWLVDCGADISPLEIDLGDGSLEISKEMFVLPESVYKDEKGRCATNIFWRNEEGYHLKIFGIPLFKGYVITFDGQARKIGFQKKTK